MTVGFSYSVFDGILQSEVRLDGLPEAAHGRPHWAFRLAGSPPCAEPGPLVGAERLTPALQVALHRCVDGGMRLRYSALGIGEFAVSADGSTITWSPGEDPPMEHLRWILLGRVMAVAFYLSGTFCLHASAVAFDRGAVCFMAPKSHGKSTLAAGMVAAGAALVSDDLVPLDPGPPVRVRPGVPSLRLRDPRVAGLPAGTRRDGGSGKTAIDGLPPSRVLLEGAPLRAAYVLAPVTREPAPGRAAAATRMPPRAAFQALAGHGSIAPLLDAGMSRVLFTRASAVARSVPVYTLRVLRDLDRLPEVVDQIRAWQGGTAGGAARALGTG